MRVKRFNHVCFAVFVDGKVSTIGESCKNIAIAHNFVILVDTAIFNVYILS